MSNLKYRKYVISVIISICFVIIFSRVFYLQIIDESYKISADNNFKRRVVQYPARGLIFDRNGALLVCNEAAFDLMVIPGRTRKFDTLSFINNLDISIEDFRRKMERAKTFSYFTPSLFYRQMTSLQYARFQEYMFKYPGFFVQDRTLRRYKHGIAAHVLGDVGEVTQRMIDSDRYYRMGDYAGLSGIERSYEKELRGQKGLKIFLVDVHNRVQGSYLEGRYDTLAIPGKNLKLTLDAELQKYSEQLMQNKKGAIVAIEPSSGEVLAMVSSPSFDPQLLVGRQRGKNYDSLVNIPHKPLFNRAVSATYPPGSLLKVPIALIALQEDVITSNTFLPCDQSLVRCRNHPIANSVAKSIQYSCNPYYYLVGRQLVQRGFENSIFRDSPIGIDMWKNKMLALGFEKQLDVGLPAVKKGLVPGSDFYDRIYGKHRWAYSTVYSLFIGQGEVLTSTLQLANLCAIIANRGWYINPYLVKKIDDENICSSKKHKNFTPFDKKNFETIIEGMDYAVNRQYGTAYWSRIQGITVCGKTGTVQNPHGENHSVFFAFAPKENPVIAIAVYIENAGYGSVWAAPTANLIIEKYINGKISNKYNEHRILEADFINIDNENIER